MCTGLFIVFPYLPFDVCMLICIFCFWSMLLEICQFYWVFRRIRSLFHWFSLLFSCFQVTDFCFYVCGFLPPAYLKLLYSPFSWRRVGAWIIGLRHPLPLRGVAFPSALLELCPAKSDMLYFLLCLDQYIFLFPLSFFFNYGLLRSVLFSLLVFRNFPVIMLLIPSLVLL